MNCLGEVAVSLDEDELRGAIGEQLSRHSVLTLATAQGGEPHAVSLMYAYLGFDVFWLSDPKTRHSRHLDSGGLAAVTIARQYDDFKNIQGLQMTGIGRRLTGEEESERLELLAARYAFLREFAQDTLAGHLGAAGVYQFCPSTVTLIDNSRGFGFKQTLVLRPRADTPAR
ncbi:MAG: pyridoxamine 5'-phosphate oxidase family protein [Pseudomonadales bacterium]|nr:pyridoxamine 5'-phosphate oxidase family protein [Pseudomonadales bacterium]